MARNKYAGDCYECGLTVAPGTGHFEKNGSGWRVKHANVPGDGRITCVQAEAAETILDHDWASPPDMGAQ